MIRYIPHKKEGFSQVKVISGMSRLKIVSINWNIYLNYMRRNGKMRKIKLNI